MQQLVELGLTEHQIKQLSVEIDELGSVLQEIGVDKQTQELLISMHASSWFQVEGSDEILVVAKGGRQGCRFGGKICNLAYGRALKKFYSKAADLGILTEVHLNRTSVTDRTKEQCESTIVFDITFVDDEAAVITASVPAHLLSNLQLLVNALIETFAFLRRGDKLETRQN